MYSDGSSKDSECKYIGVVYGGGGESFEMGIWDGVLGCSREAEPKGCIYIERKSVLIRKSQDLLYTSWTSRRADGVILV